MNNNVPSITFLNSSGDITINWDKDREEEILALIEKKMALNYHFFILKPRLGGILGQGKKAAKSIDEIRAAGNVVIPDALVKDVIMNLGDHDVSAAVASGAAKISVKEKEAQRDVVRRAKDAKEVVQNQTIAVRNFAGG